MSMIPWFDSTGEAVEFGTANAQNEIVLNMLVVRRHKLIDEAHALSKKPDETSFEMQREISLICQSQLCREAYEAATEPNKYTRECVNANQK